MDLNLAPNPTVPTAPALPRAFPEPSRLQKSQALASLFAERTRPFVFALALIFVSVALLEGSIHLTFDNGSTIALLLGLILLTRIATLPAKNSELRKRGNVGCLFLLALFALSAVPSGSANPEKSMHGLMAALLVSAGFFLSLSSFLAALGICSGVYAYAALQLPFSQALPFWLELALGTALSLFLHRAQSKLCQAYCKLALTDEARFQVYSDAAETAQKSAKRFERLSAASKEALILHSAGLVTDVNPAAESFLRVPRENLLGKAVEEILSRGSGRFASQFSDPRNPALARIKVLRGDGTAVEAFAYNHEIVFPEGASAVLGLRPAEREIEGEPVSRQYAGENLLN